MFKLLHIDSSSRPSLDPSGGEGSYSRQLAGLVLTSLKQKHPELEVIYRDLSKDPIGHIEDDTIKGYYTPSDSLTPALKEATALSDQLITEIKEADAIIISAPIYNFSVPSALKAWIDQIMRIGHTFSYADGQFAGLVKDKPTYLALTYGAAGYLEGGPLEPYDFLKPYLNLVLNFIGLTSVTTFALEATTATPDVIETNMTSMQQTIHNHFSKD
jgi:FMN-dependent NADH-azoreductase